MPQPVDYQHLVPTEVWMACWAFCTLRQLRRISVVCRLFRSLSLEFLFHHQSLNVEVLTLSLTPDNWIDHFHHLHRMAVRLDSLAASPFPASIRSWRVTFPYSPSSPQWWRSYIKHAKMFDSMQDRVTNSFFTTLGLCRNISSLHIKTYRIDAAAWQTLLCLPNLYALHLDAVQIVTGNEGIADSLLKTGLAALRKLRSLSPEARQMDTGNETSAISGFRHNRGLAEPRQFRSLYLPDARHLLDAFSASEFPHLIHLSILAIRSAEDMEPFVRFVEQLPRLESLTVIRPPPTSPLRYIHIPLHSLPLLHTLAGPSYLIRSLVSGRPIRSVRVVEYGLELRDQLCLCVDISRSTVPVHALALPRATPTFEFLHRVLALFPDVQELHLAIKNPVDHMYCTYPGKGPEYAVDERIPVFCDAEAFDRLPTEEHSDDETEDAAAEDVWDEFRVHPSTHLHWGYTEHTEVILAWIFGGLLDLPSNIETFRLETGADEEPPLKKQHQALVSLSKRYTHLREVQVGRYDRIWRREGSGDVWKAEGMTGIRIVHGRNDDRESRSATN
ncbi:hypothetical protein MSAN_01703800 [Mycena sanguinolenta]|uniref:F-box domain-containing protein n=1 Tax=Mycena sanguinolenta TaxID=230812 RepID=A0A8H7CVQ8_9AGAR|nr:hypothetical protein MSAN_01703800 [Mycena sanguinolenta]